MKKPYYEKPHGSNYIVAGICKGPFPIHIHEAVEIIFITEGNAVMHINGSERMLLPGDCAVVFPEMTHGYENVSENAEGLCVAITTNTINELNNTFHTMKPDDPVIHIDENDEEIWYVIHKLQKLSPKQDDLMLLPYIHVYVVALLTRMKLAQKAKTVEKGLTYEVLQYVAQHFKEDLTLETTAHALGISNSHLSHIFSQQLHVNFRRYLNVIRIEHACLLLQDPEMSIARIAEECGYSCSRTFHRAFMEEYKMKPNEYRAQVTRGWHNTESLENITAVGIDEE